MTVHYTDMMISVYGGTGFVGSEFVRQNQNSLMVPRWSRLPLSNNILYLISTVDNYNVYSDPLLDVETNLTVLLETLKEIRETYGNNFTFNFVSSWFVYGDTEQPAKETSPCNPKGFYSITKRAAEQLLISYCETFDIPYRIFRLPNVLGLGDKKVSAKKNALQFLIKEMILGNPIKLYYGGNFYRDYMDVRDVADAIRFLMKLSPINEIYNVCDMFSNFRFRGLFDFCYDYIESESVVEEVDKIDFHKIVQVKSMNMSFLKLYELGWIGRYNLLGTTIPEIIEGYKRELHPSG